MPATSAAASSSRCRCTTRRPATAAVERAASRAAWAERTARRDRRVTGAPAWRACRSSCRRAPRHSPTACARRSAGSSSTAKGRASSPARAAIGARGSATARSPGRRSPRWASRTRRARSCAGTRPISSTDGRVPCAVDRHGIDPVVEHDSHGQLIWGIVEVFRLTGDRAFLRELWPHVLRAVDAIAALRAQRTTDALPRPSLLRTAARIDQPRGLRLAPRALVLGRLLRRARARRCGRRGRRARRRRGEPHASARCATRCAAICTPRSRRAIEEHGIDFVPGSVELGDFDPTSTRDRASIRAARAALCRRRAGAEPSSATGRSSRRAAAASTTADAYTPYEVRNARCARTARPEAARPRARSSG